MLLAMAAAPNPLSILTTETPIAQLFSIASSAVSPPKRTVSCSVRSSEAAAPSRVAAAGKVATMDGADAT